MDAGDVIAIVAAAISLVALYLSWRSAKSAEESSRASVRSADAAEKSANAEHELLQLTLQDRADADLQRRISVWHRHPVHAHAVEFKFLGAEAHHVSFLANVVLQVDRRKGDTSSPMYKGDRMIVVAQDPAGWNKRVTVSWAEAEGPDVQRLSNTYVI